MTQKDAFDFLELPESATKSQIKIRLVEKLEYFEHLSQHAASDFLRRIHAKNVDKVRAIQREFFPWSSFESESEIILPLEHGDEIILPEEEIIHTTPIIISSAGQIQEAFPVKREGPFGWLISHTENSPTKVYPLQVGKNYIGRKLQAGFTPFIVIENDPYISRIHAVVDINEKPTDECYIMDSAASNNGQPSKNGTYVNGDKKRIEEKVGLNDGDTIQIGVTKLMLKYNTKELKDILSEVERSGYITTIEIDN